MAGRNHPHGPRLRVAVLTGLLLAGCPSASLPPPDGPPCGTLVFTQLVSAAHVRQLDLLFVVDDSPSMLGESGELGPALAQVIRALRWQDYPGTSVHVGVISSDLGAGALPSLSSACSAPLGADGLLLRAPASDDPTCAGLDAGPPYLRFEPGDDLDAFAERVRCLVPRGAAGCGFEQPLEAALKALTPASSPLRFQQVRGGVVESDTPGHGDGANAGFLREDSRLVVVFVGDEDDCSSADLDLFAPRGAAPRYPSELTEPVPDPGVQCASHPQALHPIARYVDGFAALRPGRADRLSVVALGGVAEDVLAAHSDVRLTNGFEYLVTDHEALLADPSMQSTLDATGLALEPACTRPSPDAPDDPSLQREAYPPRRLVALVQGLERVGSFGPLASLCSAADAASGDYTLDLTSLAAELDHRYAVSPGDPSLAALLPRELERDDTGRVRCSVHETLAPGDACERHPGRTLVGYAAEREVCVVEQLVVPDEERLPGTHVAGAGWYYDDFATADYWVPALLRFTTEGRATPGSAYRVECVTSLTRADGGVARECDAAP